MVSIFFRHQIDVLVQDVTPLLTHWSYVFLALSHWNELVGPSGLIQETMRNAEIPKSPCPASYTRQNSKGTHQLLNTCILGTYLKISHEQKNINDETQSECSGTHMDHGKWSQGPIRKYIILNLWKCRQFKNFCDFTRHRMALGLILLILCNSLAPGRCSRSFRRIIFKLIIQNSSLSAHCGIALRWMPQNLTNEKSTQVQVMAWRHQATSHHPSQCWSRPMSPCGVTRSHV